MVGWDSETQKVGTELGSNEFYSNFSHYYDNDDEDDDDDDDDYDDDEDDLRQSLAIFGDLWQSTVIFGNLR